MWRGRLIATLLAAACGETAGPLEPLVAVEVDGSASLPPLAVLEWGQWAGEGYLVNGARGRIGGAPIEFPVRYTVGYAETSADTVTPFAAAFNGDGRLVAYDEETDVPLPAGGEAIGVGLHLEPGTAAAFDRASCRCLTDCLACTAEIAE